MPESDCICTTACEAAKSPFCLDTIGKENIMSYTKAFLTGGLIGAILALLYSPKTGNELRRDLRRGSRRLYKRANQTVDDLREQTEDILTEGRKQVRALRHQAETILDEAKASAEHLVPKVR
jgi:gas vesicle protein